MDNKMKIISTLFIAIPIFLSTANTSIALIKTSKAAEGIPAPKHIYPTSYTLNAEKATLIRNKNHTFTLVLDNIHNKVIYKYNNLTPPENGTLGISTFVHLWLDKQDAVAIPADITGVQKNNKTIGHTQFYLSALIANPTYNADEKTLKIDVKLNTQENFAHTITKMESVSIFIDGSNLREK